ncbi:MAG: hypothetical protein ACK5O5_00405, partial [bacterium]
CQVSRAAVIAHQLRAGKSQVEPKAANAPRRAARQRAIGGWLGRIDCSRRIRLPATEMAPGRWLFNEILKVERKVPQRRNAKPIARPQRLRTCSCIHVQVIDQKIPRGISWTKSKISLAM